MFFSEKIFDNAFLTQNLLMAGEYENCTFKGFDFSSVDLSEFKFIECIFDNCNLSMVKLRNAVLSDTKFIGCKMLGLHFNECNQIGLSPGFENCNLSQSSFYKTKLKKTIFKKLKLIETDFTESDVSSSLFEDCDFEGATFENTNLSKADFTTSFNYSIDPERNFIKKARFSLSGVQGLLHKYDIEIGF